MFRPSLGGLVFLAVVLPGALLSAQDKEKPKPKPAYLGVQIAKDKDEESIVIRLVLANSPAEKAGLKGGDRLISFDGVKPATIAAMVSVIRSLKPGKKVKVLIERDGKAQTIEVVPVAVDD